MSTTITSPFLFTGETLVGVVSLNFTDGVAVFDGTLSQEAADLLRAHGFTITAPVIGQPEALFVDDSPLVAPEGDADDGDIPAKNASKAEWIDYAETQGHFRGSLEELTRTEIQSLFEGEG